MYIYIFNIIHRYSTYHSQIKDIHKTTGNFSKAFSHLQVAAADCLLDRVWWESLVGGVAVEGVTFGGLKKVGGG